MRKKKLIIAVYSVLVVLIVATAGLAVTVSALSSQKKRPRSFCLITQIG